MNMVRRMTHLCLTITDKIFAAVINCLPMSALKAILANHRNPTVRRKALIALGADISESCHLNQGVRLVMDYPFKSNLRIGDRVAVGPNVQFICNSGPHPQSHLLEIEYVEKKLVKDESIFIDDDVWIGAGVIILPGVRVGKCSIVGAGALVVENVPEYSVAAGAPAKVIRTLENPALAN